MAILISLPILALGVILQSTVFSRFTLLNGPADIVLLLVVCWALQDNVKDEWAWAVVGGLLVGFVSAVPVWVPLAGFLAVTWAAVALKKRIWQIPILALFFIVFIGTIFTQLLTFATLRLLGTPIDPVLTLNLITLPSVLLNLLLAIPVNGVISEISRWLYPEEIEI